jgi:transposase-like protein
MATPISLPEPVFPHPIRTEWKLLAIFKKDNPVASIGDCARAMGVNYHTIRAWIRQPLYQSYENWFLRRESDALPFETRLRNADMKDELDEFAVEMHDRLRSIVETTTDDKLIAQVAFDALDRAGYAPEKRDAKRPISLILTTEVLAALAQRARVIRDETIVVGEVVGHSNG